MSSNLAPDWISLHPSIEAALQAGTPLVALESTVITHGLPWPTNFELALQLEEQVRDAGAVPATIALVEGRIVAGAGSDQLKRLASSDEVIKINRRDLAAAMQAGCSGGTTVSATMTIARACGLRILATGGIGGVHRGDAGDISADLPELARTQIAVVSSGAKAFLDLPRTLEWLESAAVPVLGWKTDSFPAFISHSSGLPLSWRLEKAAQAAALLKAHWSIPATGGVLIAVPCPAEDAIPWQSTLAALEGAEKEALALGVGGKELTPFLLAKMAELSGGKTVDANLSLLRNNARVAAQIATALILNG